MPYAPYELAGFLAPYGEKPHLFCVMNDPCPDGLCMVLMITTIYPNRSHDPTCVLNQGDHVFLRHPSYVAYRLASTSRADHVARMVDRGLYIPKEDWDPPVFNRVAMGVHQSPFVSRGMLKYSVANGI